MKSLLRKKGRFGLRISDWGKSKKFLCGLGCVLGVLLCLFRMSDSQESGDACVSESCHETVYSEGTSNPFIHTPFLEKQCDQCHLKTATASTGFPEPLSKSIVQPIIVSQPDYQLEHTVLLRGLLPQAAYDIYVTLHDTSGNRLSQEFRGTVPVKVQDVRTNDRKAPQIYDLKIGPVSQGVFLETTVTWKTDKPSTTLVEYGLSDRYGQYTSEDNALVKGHSKNVYELEIGKDYHYRVVSRDVFGNEAVSGDFHFSTEDVSPVKVSTEAWEDKWDETILSMRDGALFLLGSEVGVYVETSRPTRISVEYVKVEEPAVELAAQASSVADTEDIHDDLREGKDLTIDACYQCHPPEGLGVSHPVGIKPSSNTTIPDDLPTLEGGVLTCVTCHTPHGGIREYFARKDFSKDICISCHKGY
jgi:predicted CXXCH cytochrome family protein